MPTTEVASAVIEEASKSHDPIITGLAFVLGVVILLVTISKPIMGLVKDYKKTNVDGAKADAEVSLFDQLSAQIKSNTAAINQLIIEKNEWFVKALSLEHEVERLKTFEVMVNSMKERLNEKDKVIESRDEEIRTLTRAILEMKDRIHALELRLVKDEQQFCHGCVLKETSNEKLSGVRS
jgi:predicted RNase H-like nuclease (RuvC/YqgF family)